MIHCTALRVPLIAVLTIPVCAASKGTRQQIPRVGVGDSDGEAKMYAVQQHPHTALDTSRHPAAAQHRSTTPQKPLHTAFGREQQLMTNCFNSEGL